MSDQVDENDLPSALMVGTEWWLDKCDFTVSVVQKEIACWLRERDINVNCTVLSATDEEKDDAKCKGVHLLLPQDIPDLENKTPSRDWLLLHESFFAYLQQLKNVYFILGHDCQDGTMHAARSIQQQLFQNAKLISLKYDIPEKLYNLQKSEQRKREKQSAENSKLADFVVSIGQKVWNHYNNKFRIFENKEHLCYLPYVDTTFLTCGVKEPSVEHGIYIFSIQTRANAIDDEDFEQFDIIARAIGKVSEGFEGRAISELSWNVRGIQENLCNSYEKRLYKKAYKPANLSINTAPICSLNELFEELRQTYLAVLGACNNRDSFGIVGLLACTIGVPVLLSRNSGLAMFLKKTFPGLADPFIVDDAETCSYDDIDRESDKWVKKIQKILYNYSGFFESMQNLKKAIQNCASEGIIAESHAGVLEWFHSQTLKIREEENRQNERERHTEQLAKHEVPSERQNVPVSRGEVKTTREAGEVSMKVTAIEVVENTEGQVIGRTNFQLFGKITLSKMRNIKNHFEEIGLTVKRQTAGCFILTVQCHVLEALERLWTDYEADIVNDLFEKDIKNNQALQDYQASNICVETVIETWEYIKCRLEITHRNEADRATYMNESHQLVKDPLKRPVCEIYEEEFAKVADTETIPTREEVTPFADVGVTKNADFGSDDKKNASWRPILLQRKNFPDYLDVNVLTKLKPDSEYIPVVHRLLDEYSLCCTKLKQQKVETFILKNRLEEIEQRRSMGHLPQKDHDTLSIALRSKKIAITKLKEQNNILKEEIKTLREILKKSKIKRYNSVERDDGGTTAKSRSDGHLGSLPSLPGTTVNQQESQREHYSDKDEAKESIMKEMTLEERSSTEKRTTIDEENKDPKQDKDWVLDSDVKKTVVPKHEVDSNDSNDDTDDSASVSSFGSFNSVESRNEKEEIPLLLLMCAIVQGHAGIVKVALELDLKKKHIAKALRAAVRQNNAEIVKVLLDTGIITKEINKALVLAVQKGSSSMVELLLDSGGDANATNSEEDEPLLHTAVKKNVETLRLLLSKGANVNATDSMDETALHVALEEDKFEAMKALVEAGSNITSLNEEGQSLLHVVAEDSHVRCLKYLLAKGLDVNIKDQFNQTPLHLAAAKDNVRIARLLLDAGADLTIKDKSGYTPLSIALASQSFETLRLLTDNESDPYETHLVKAEETSFSETESERNFIRLAKSLLKSGGDINAKDRDGNIPLHIATKKNWIDAVTYLLDEEADVGSFDTNGMTPLHVAALMDHDEILQYFLDMGGDVNKTDSYGLSPLHFAASGQDCVESVELLVKAKSDVNLKDKVGKTALHFAAENRTQRAANIVKILCDADAEVNIADKQMKDTPLHIAARNNNVKAAGFLIDMGADMNALNKRGKTPIELALDGNCGEVTVLLVERGAGANTE